MMSGPYIKVALPAVVQIRPVGVMRGAPGADGIGGDVSGPGSSVDGDIALFNGTSGNILKKVSALDSLKTSFLQGGTSALLRTGQGKWRDYVSLLDYIPESEHAAIFAGTSTYDCLPAMQAALAYKRPNTAYGAAYGASGYDIYCPPGTYKFSGRIEIKRLVRIYGTEGSAMANSSESTVFQFPVASDGIVIHAYNTIGDGDESPPTTQGSGTVIERLVLVGIRSGTYSASTASKPGKGIWLRGKAAIRDCKIINFDHAGIYCQVAAGGGGILEGNSNNSKIENVRVTGCFEGFHIQSADANVMMIMGCDASNIDTYGFYDLSFLGNFYAGCHAAETGNLGKCSFGGNRYYLINAALGGSTTPGTDGTVWVLVGAGAPHPQYPLWVSGNTYYLGYAYASLGANAGNVFIGCYAESDNAPSHILFPATIVGGFFGTLTTASTALRISASVITGFSQPAKNGSANAFNVRYALDIDTVVNLAAVGDHSSGFSPWKWDSTSGSWYAQHANSNSRIPYIVTTDLSTRKFGRTSNVAGGSMVFPSGLWVGGGTTNARQITYGTAAPTSGEYAVGDIIFNTAAAPSGKIGWVCTTAGVAGSTAVFKQWGVIDA